jgi:outer membrane immunogenic protein
MKKLVLGLAAGSLLLAAPALAADLNAEPVPEAPSYTAPATSAFDWTGAYVGADAGYGFFQRSSNGAKTSDDGFTGGIFGGYNYQIDPHWVVGGEADLSSGASGTGNRWSSTGRLRGGYALDNMLIYATGGLAVAGGRINPGLGNDTETHLGFVVGGGVEAAVTKNIFARAEYLYTNTDKKTYTDGTNSVKADLDGSAVRVGIGYKF